MNLSEDELREVDRTIIDTKIEEILSICQCKKVHFIRYSLGAEMAHYAALNKGSHEIRAGYCSQKEVWKEWRPEVDKIIRIGSMTTKEE